MWRVRDVANHPDAYEFRAVAVLYAGRCLTNTQFVQAIHPSNPRPAARDDRGEIALSSVVPVHAVPVPALRWGRATVERFPGVQPGQFPNSTAPGSHPGRRDSDAPGTRSKSTMTPTLNLDTLTLAAGGHSPASPEMCVMEPRRTWPATVVRTTPTCVSPVIAAFLRSWNDAPCRR